MEAGAAAAAPRRRTLFPVVFRGPVIQSDLGEARLWLSPGPGIIESGPPTGVAGPQSLLQCTRFEIHALHGQSAIAVGFPARLKLIIVSYAVI